MYAPPKEPPEGGVPPIDPPATLRPCCVWPSLSVPRVLSLVRSRAEVEGESLEALACLPFLPCHTCVYEREKHKDFDSCPL